MLGIVERTKSMPVLVNWDNPEKTIIRYQFIDPWTWPEYHTTYRRGWALISTVNYTVDLIIDFSQGGGMPPSALRHFQTVAEQVHPNRGYIVVIASNPVIRSIMNTLARIYYFHPRAALGSFAGDLEDAYRIVAQQQANRRQAIL
jgi:hypothetical protein